jgi:hypothetical protein
MSGKRKNKRTKLPKRLASPGNNRVINANAAVKTTTKPEIRPQYKLLRLGLVICFCLLIGVGSWFYISNATSEESKTPLRIGEVNCNDMPQFIQDLNFTPDSFLSTSEPRVEGLILVESELSLTPRTHRDPSWSMAGNLGPIVFGKGGDVFVAPVPEINVLNNPPQEQNKIYRLDNKDGKMQSFIDLPKAASPSPENPFGVLGLGYDCETNNMYASSVAGSTRQKEVGRLYQIDVTKKVVVAKFENTDVIGLGVFNGVKGKRLYYGLARYPEIWSIALTDKGGFIGQPRQEISLANMGPRGSDKARKIEFISDNEMDVYGIEFSFNLIAPTEKQATLYQFIYDKETDTWLAKSSSTSSN